jgi:hypothetical protein
MDDKNRVVGVSIRDNFLKVGSDDHIGSQSGRQHAVCFGQPTFLALSPLRESLIFFAPETSLLAYVVKVFVNPAGRWLLISVSTDAEISLAKASFHTIFVCAFNSLCHGYGVGDVEGC